MVVDKWFFPTFSNIYLIQYQLCVEQLISVRLTDGGPRKCDTIHRRSSEIHRHGSRFFDILKNELCWANCKQYFARLICSIVIICRVDLMFWKMGRLIFIGLTDGRLKKRDTILSKLMAIPSVFWNYQKWTLLSW